MIRKKWPKERKGTENRMFGCISKKNNNNKGTDLKKKKRKRERKKRDRKYYLCMCLYVKMKRMEKKDGKINVNCSRYSIFL